jgi:hypothetical protein
MKIVYHALIIVAGIAFILGVIIKLFMEGGTMLPPWLLPLTLWRGAIGAISFALVFILLDVRDVILKKNT